MKIVSGLLVLAGIILCVIAFSGHYEAWSAAAVCFFAFSMIAVAQRNKK